MIGQLPRPHPTLLTLERGDEPLKVGEIDANFRKGREAYDRLTSELDMHALNVFHVLGYGAKANGLTDDYAAIIATMTDAAVVGGTVAFSLGTFLTNTAIAVPANVSVWIMAGATVKAGAAMTSVFLTPLSTRAIDQHIYGEGTIDGNNLADWGIQVRYAAHYGVCDLHITQTLNGFVKVGDSGAPNNSYELFVHQVHGTRGGTNAVVAGSRGFWVSNCSDSSVSECVAVGTQVGFRVDSNNNRFVSCHAWSDSQVTGNGWMDTCFDDNGSVNTWVACEADTPQTYMYRFRQFSSIVLGGACFNNGFYGTDNTVIGMYFDQTAPFATVMGVNFSGSSGGHRILQDISINGGSYSSMTILGSQWSNVTTPTRAHIPRIDGGLSINGDVTVTDGDLLVTRDDGSNALMTAKAYATSALLRGRRVDGTVGSEAALGANEDMLDILGSVYDGSAFADTAQLAFQTSQAQTGSAHGSFLYLELTPNGTIVRKRFLTMNQTGILTVGFDILTATANGDGAVIVRAGTHSGANDRDAYVESNRGGTAQWRAGVLGSINTDGAFRVRDVVNSVTPLTIAPATGKVTVLAATTSGATLNIPHGAAPTSPVDGDIWTTTSGLFVRINGVTFGPLS